MSSFTDATTLASWDAVETARRIRTGEVTAREVADAALARADVAAHLGAVVTATAERARGVAGRAGGSGVLAGVPTYVKDLAQLAGVAMGWGSRGAGGYISRKTDPFVADFEKTGVVALGKSATPEMGLTATTEPLASGPCRNPWDPTRSAGGSSGGSASLVAAGVVPMAHASDGGGSIRVPAACCGLVGLKPSRFRLDMGGSNLLPVNVATDGVVTRTVRDTVLFYEAMEATRAPRKAPPIGRVDLRASQGLKIGVYVDAPIGSPVDPEVQRAVLAAAETCRQLGHHVEEIRCPFAGSVLDDFLDYWGLLAWMQLVSAKAMLHRDFDVSQVEPWTSGLARTFTANKRKVLGAVMRLRTFGARYADVMRRWDVLVSPTTAQPAPPLGFLGGEGDFATKYERLRAYCNFTPIQNASGAPAISLPLGRSGEGLPIGVHLAAAYGGDRTLLELSLQLEEATPWPLMPPRDKWLLAGA